MPKEKVETITENLGEEDGLKVMRVTKWVERRTSLKSLTGKYDNVNAGNAMSAIVRFNDQEDFSKKMDILGQKVLDETERDIARSISNIKSLMNDPDNNALVGLGTEVEYNDLISQIDGFDDLVGENDEMKIPHGFVEEEFN